MNRTLNSKFVGGCKTFYNFKNCIIDIIDFFTNKTKIYQETNISNTRSLEFYVKKNLVVNLISNEDLKKIKLNLKNYMKENKYPYLENEYDSDSFSNYEKKIPNFIELFASSDSENQIDSDLNYDNSDGNDNNNESDKDDEDIEKNQKKM